MISNIYTSDSTWVVPNNVTSATVECWGGGGRGCDMTHIGPELWDYPGGGGGSGAYASSTIAVTAGSTLIARFTTVASAGKTALCSPNGSTPYSVRCTGGTDSTYIPALPGYGGTGGTAQNGTVKLAGNRGGNMGPDGGPYYTGAGGGGAPGSVGQGEAGAHGSDLTSTTSPGGLSGTGSLYGTGGPGATWISDAIAGYAFGGGGGGGCYQHVTGAQGGSAGVIISYNINNFVNSAQIT
jgi:hypothetical protein